MARLPGLEQFRGGLQLRADLDEIIKSYAAGKVITNIIKTPAVEANEAEGIQAQPAVMYTVEEYLNIVKTQIGQIIGDGSGVSLTSLDTAVKAINNKTFADYVKILGTAVYAAPESTGDTPSYSVTDNASDAVKSKLRATNTTLPVYNEDNSIIYDSTGAQLTYDITTGTLSGIPCILNVAESKKGTTKVYTPIEKDVTFKVFAIGDWKFSELESDYLLDNSEIQVMAYASAIDQLAIDLAKDSDLLTTVQKAIGEEAIKATLEANFKDINSRIKTLESISADNNTTLASVVAMTQEAEESDEDFAARKATAMAKASVKGSDIATSVEKKIDDNSDIKVISQKAAAIALNSLEDKVDGNYKDIQALITELKGETYAVQKVEEFIIPAETPSDGAEYTSYTTFNLTAVPTPADENKAFMVVINGLMYFENDHFTVNREDKSVTWAFTKANGGFDINYKLTDKVKFVFYTGVTKGFEGDKITFGNGTQLWIDEEPTADIPEEPASE